GAGRKREAERYAGKREPSADCCGKLNIAEAKTFTTPEPAIAPSQKNECKGGSRCTRDGRSCAQPRLEGIEHRRGKNAKCDAAPGDSIRKQIRPGVYLRSRYHQCSE